MAENETIESTVVEEPAEAKRKRRWFKRLGWLLAAIVTAALLAIAAFNTSIGKRFIADQIASYAPASGLKIEIGRIQGDIYRDAVLRDVRLSDPQGVFLTIPEVELDWRPLSWLSSGLDVRKLVTQRGELSRLPELLPGDPDAPILPDFDIRIDRLEINDLTIAAGVATDTAERLNLAASADIRNGFVELGLKGQVGALDRIDLALLAVPSGDRFDLDLDYRAPVGGVIAGMLGSDSGYTARILGDGPWSNWLGHAVIRRNGERFGAFQLTNRSGVYGVLGQLYAGMGDNSLLGRALGDTAGVDIDGTFVDSRFDGSARLRGQRVDVNGSGVIDLAANRFDDFEIDADLLDPTLFGETVQLRDTMLRAELDGAFRELSISHQLTASQVAIGTILADGLRQDGVGRFDGEALVIPLRLAVSGIDTGVESITTELQRGTLSGELVYSDGLVRIEPLIAEFPRVGARLAFRYDPAQAALRVAGPVNARGIAIQGIGTAQANGNIEFALQGSNPWTFRSTLGGRIANLTNSTIESLAGNTLSFRSSMSANAGSPLRFGDLVIRSEEVDIAGDASVGEGGFTLDVTGNHTRFGAFSADYSGETGANSANVRLASPLPAAGLRDVELGIAPADEGFRVATKGQSLLGQFDGVLDLRLPENGSAVLDIDQLRVWETSVAGVLALEENGARGNLALTGGGLEGEIALTPASNGQRFAADIVASNAVFGGTTAISIGEAEIDVGGSFGEQATRINGTLTGRAIRYGSLFLGRIAARADIENGEGDLVASLVGRQGGRFNLQLDSNFSAERIDAIVRGNYAGTSINMPRRAVLRRDAAGQWALARTGIRLGDGTAIVSGQFGGGVELDAMLVDVPLSLADLAQGELGLGGTMSGALTYVNKTGSLPSGDAKIRIEGLSRSGLIVASQPIDLSLVVGLDARQLNAQAIFRQSGNRLGWIEAAVAGMPQSGDLFNRISAGALNASMRYEGASEALWRLAALDVIDLSGPVRITATARGTVADPQVRGKVASSDLRVRSVLSGTDIENASVNGDFIGSTLNLRSFSGSVAGGGAVTGSGTIDLANLGPGRGPQLDIRASARQARLLDARGLRATVTGPLRIVSSGLGGTIAGRLEVDNASWRLGTADEDVSLPSIATREINLPSEVERVSSAASPWRYLIDARARNRIDVDGMGLDSEWRADIILRGTTDDPRIGGEARVVRGSYSFAGARFDLVSGVIEFDENVPIDPRIDVTAETTQSDLDVEVTVRGNALSPEIAFSSNPALPEEEILARLLFGDGITELSATDALQLGAAVASLRGGGGMDPINALRSEIGLDRLRIVGADPVLGRETGVALGENLGRRLYVELITDGREYSATELEFRITSWLSLLASVSTVGRDSVLIEARRDY